MDEHEHPFESLGEGYVEPDRGWRSIVRNFRRRVLWRTVTTHNGDLPAILRFPLGFSWRRVNGVDWCPFCMSISPVSAIKLMWGRQVWDPNASLREMQDLIDRGEMDPNVHSPWEAFSPMDGYAFGSYIFNDVGEPVLLVIRLPRDNRYALHLNHVYDLPPVVIPALLAHMNRIAPSLHWSISHTGRVQWAATVTATASVSDDTDTDADEHPE